MRSYRLVTDRVVRDPGLERKLIEYNRENACYYMILIGSILVLLAVMW